MTWRVFTMIVAALVVAGGLAWIFFPETELQPVKVAAPAQVAEEVKRQPRTEIVPKKVKAYPHKVKADLSLPVAALGNVNEHVLAAAKVDADDRPHTLITTLDAETGEVRSYDRPDPLPWIAREVRGEAGLTYGLKNGEPMMRLTLRQNLLQVKAVRLGAVATLDHDGELYAGIGAFYRW